MTLKAEAQELQFRIASLTNEDRNRVETEWNISVPLVKFILDGYVTRVGYDGQSALQELDAELTNRYGV
jgi:hypothetical protein